MHKDKFVAPILHDEMQTMEVKKNGKVEHSDNAHDDQVFSYLLALYVWYDGIDVMERYNIQKNTLKTDEDIEVEDLELEKTVNDLTPVDLETATRDNDDIDNELEEQMEYIETAQKGSLYNEFTEMQRAQDQQCLTNLLQDKRTKEIYAKQMHLDLAEPALGGVMETASVNNNTVQLPDELFGNTDDWDDDYSYPQDNLVGNLADAWRSLK